METNTDESEMRLTPPTDIPEEADNRKNAAEEQSDENQEKEEPPAVGLDENGHETGESQGCEPVTAGDAESRQDNEVSRKEEKDRISPDLPFELPTMPKVSKTGSNTKEQATSSGADSGTEKAIHQGNEPVVNNSGSNNQSNQNQQQADDLADSSSNDKNTTEEQSVLNDQNQEKEEPTPDNLPENGIVSQGGKPAKDAESRQNNEVSNKKETDRVSPDLPFEVPTMSVKIVPKIDKKEQTTLDNGSDNKTETENDKNTTEEQCPPIEQKQGREKQTARNLEEHGIENIENQGGEPAVANDAESRQDNEVLGEEEKDRISPDLPFEVPTMPMKKVSKTGSNSKEQATSSGADNGNETAEHQDNELAVNNNGINNQTNKDQEQEEDLAEVPNLNLTNAVPETCVRSPDFRVVATLISPPPPPTLVSPPPNVNNGQTMSEVKRRKRENSVLYPRILEMPLDRPTSSLELRPLSKHYKCNDISIVTEEGESEEMAQNDMGTLRRSTSEPDLTKAVLRISSPPQSPTHDGPSSSSSSSKKPRLV